MNNHYELKQRAKAFVDSSVVCQYPNGGWRGESPPNPEEDLSNHPFPHKHCLCWINRNRTGESHSRNCWWKNIERIDNWEPLHDMPKHLWLSERSEQWHPIQIPAFDDNGNRLPHSYEDQVTTWRGGRSKLVWKIRALDIPETVGWIMGIGCLNRWAAFLPDGTPCPHLAGPWERVPVNSRWQERFGVPIVHSTRWEAALSLWGAGWLSGSLAPA